MALIRGFGSAHPCPVCLIHESDLADLLKSGSRHTPVAMQLIVKEAMKLSKKEQEKKLKAYGLRGVEVSRFKSKL